MSENENLNSSSDSDRREQSAEKYFYERAIQGMEFHTTRFNTWMNFYALFVGAFFVAYYSLNNEKELMNFVVIIAGYITSVCWLGSLFGYYSWLIGWTKIVIHHENIISEIIANPALRVYSLVDHKYLINTGFSTQKITKIFIYTVITSWLFALGYEIYNTFNYCNSCCMYYIAISVPVLFAGLTYLIYRLIRKNLLSDVSRHYLLIENSGGAYTVEPPSV